MNAYGLLTKVDFAQAINVIVESILPRFTKDEVLVVSVRMEAENYDTEHRVARNFNIVYYRPNNYTFVGVPVDVSAMFPDKLELELIRYSYHDSCWRSDGTEHIMRKIANEIFEELKDDGAGYSVYTAFGMSGIKLYAGRVSITDHDSAKLSKYSPLSK